ncbi:MAG: hypothetical protein Q9221_002176 [Calogaya cf. arnoldii]
MAMFGSELYIPAYGKMDFYELYPFSTAIGLEKDRTARIKRTANVPHVDQLVNMDEAILIEKAIPLEQARQLEQAKLALEELLRDGILDLQEQLLAAGGSAVPFDDGGCHKQWGTWKIG